MLDNLRLLNVVLLLVVGREVGPRVVDCIDKSGQGDGDPDGGGRKGNLVSISVL